MSCRTETAGGMADELAFCLQTLPSVVAADVLEADETPSGRMEIDAVVKATDRGTLPNSVTNKISQSALGIETCTDANAIGHKRVLIR
jgi:hypothetical protein